MDKEKEVKEVNEREGLLKREYAWCVVQVHSPPEQPSGFHAAQMLLGLCANFTHTHTQVDRANFMLRNALWGVALGMHAQVNNNFHA